MQKVKQLPVPGKEIWECLLKKIEKECGISIYNINSGNGYFLFEFGEDTVWHFRVKECPKAFKFGIWLFQDKNDLKVNLFGELEWLIDKFKPSQTAFSESFTIKDVFKKGTDWKKLIDDDCFGYGIQKFFFIMKSAPIFKLYEMYGDGYSYRHAKKNIILWWYLKLWWNNKVTADFHEFLRCRFAKVVFNIDAFILKIATLGGAKLEWGDWEGDSGWTCSPKWEMYAIVKDDTDESGKLFLRAERAGKVFKFLENSYRFGWKSRYLDTSRMNLASTMTKEDIVAANAVKAKRIFFKKDNLNEIEFNDTWDKITINLQTEIYEYERKKHENK